MERRREKNTKRFIDVKKIFNLILGQFNCTIKVGKDGARMKKAEGKYLKGLTEERERERDREDRGRKERAELNK